MNTYQMRYGKLLKLCYIASRPSKKIHSKINIAKWSFQLIKKRFFIFTFVTLVVIINTSLVYYASKNQILLPQLVVELIDFLSDYFDEELTDSFSSTENQAENKTLTELIPPQIGKDSAAYSWLYEPTKDFTALNNSTHNELELVGSTCNSVSTLKRNTSIYRWVDDDGTTHLSDRPRTVDSRSPVQIIGTITPELLSIKYLNNEGSLELKNKINASVTNAKQFFEKIVPKSLIKPVKINFRLFSEESEYDYYRKRMAPKLSPSIGFYTSKNNESVVMMHSEEQGIKTSVHEAMHSINRHWFGKMSRWINEGIAEYAETDQSNLPRGSNREYRIKHEQLLPLSTLLQAEEIEWRNQSTNMYTTSYAFIAYLMEENTPVLSRLLLAESVNGCNTLKLQDVERISGFRLPHLQNEFNVWVNDVVRANNRI